LVLQISVDCVDRYIFFQYKPRAVGWKGPKRVIAICSWWLRVLL